MTFFANVVTKNMRPFLVICILLVMLHFLVPTSVGLNEPKSPETMAEIAKIIHENKAPEDPPTPKPTPPVQEQEKIKAEADKNNPNPFNIPVYESGKPFNIPVYGGNLTGPPSYFR